MDLYIIFTLRNHTSVFRVFADHPVLNSYMSKLEPYTSWAQIQYVKSSPSERQKEDRNFINLMINL